MLMKKKFIISGVIICLAISFLAYMGFESSARYYYTVDELVAQQESVQNKNVRVNGQVVAESIKREVDSRTLNFAIIEGDSSLPVVYQGTVPDSFTGGVDVVVEGYLNLAGVFQANSIITKCPSKYVPED